MSLEILCSDARLAGCVSFAAITTASPIVFCADYRRKLVSTFTNASGSLKWQSDGVVQSVGPQVVFSDGTFMHAIGTNLWLRINSSNVIQASGTPPRISNPLWGFAASASVLVVPYNSVGVQTMNATTGAIIGVLPDLTSKITLAVGGGGYIYCFNEDRATMTVLSVDASGNLALASNTRTSVPNGHIIRGALVDGTTLVVATDHRVLTFSLTDPTAPAFVSSTTIPQTIRGLTMIVTGRYWLATDETVPAQQQYFNLPTVAACSANGVLISFSPLEGGAENTPTPYTFGGLPTPPPGAVLPPPTILPAAGLYSTTQTVTITQPTLGASIYYTTDGSAPTTGSTPYTVAFPVSATTTVKAIAAATGVANSTTASSTYTFAAQSAINLLTFNGRIDAAAYRNGILYLGGQFTSITDAGGAKSRTRLAAIDMGTGLVTAWNPTADNSVRTLKVDPSGRLWCGGDFANCGGSPRQFVARFDAASATLDAFTSGISATGGIRVTDFDFDTTTGGTYLAGNFLTVNAVTHNHFAAYDASDVFRTASPNLNTTLQLAWGVRYVASTGKVYVVGGQGTAAGVVIDSTTLATGTWPLTFGGPGPIAFAMEIAGGIAYLAGGFTSLQGSTRNRFGAVDLTTSATLQAFNPNASASGENITVDGNGIIYPVGDYTTIASTARVYASAFTATGALVTTWNAGLSASVAVERALVIGSLIVLTGDFFNPSGGTKLYVTSIA